MTEIIIILILVAINGFFSLSEVALISARKLSLQTDAKNGSKAAKAALLLQDNPDMYLSTCQIGITVVSILTGIYSGKQLAGDFAALLEDIGMAQAVASTVSQTIIVIVATYLQVELGELFPKRVGLDIADKLARAVGPFMLFLAKITKPIVAFLTWNNNVLSWMFGLKPQDSRVTEAEIKSIIEEGTRSGEVQEVEQDIMERALFLGDQRVVSLMTHRTDLVALDVNMTQAEVLKVLTEHSFANYPVVNGTIEQTLGIISLKDLVLIIGKEDFNLKDIIQEPTYIPESMTVYKALAELKLAHHNCGLVFDEFGSLSGIIALKDIMEGLVGSIDEPNEMPDIIERQDKKSWVVSGQCLFYDFLAYFDMENEYSREFSTVGGLVLDQLEHIPHVGERLLWNNFCIQVVEMDETRIEKVVVTLRDTE